MRLYLVSTVCIGRVRDVGPLVNEFWLWNLFFRRDIFVLKNKLVVNVMETMEGRNLLGK